MNVNFKIRINALAKFLNVNPDDICISREQDSSPENIIYSHDKREYMVLNDIEADEKAEEYILDTLWAFNADFIYEHIQCNDYSVSKKDYENIIKSIKDMQENCCEGCNEIIRSMIGEYIDDFISDAIAYDGRGHFLSPYDGEENQEGNFFIYRIN